MQKIPRIVEAIDEMYMAKAQSYPSKSCHASKIGHPCARYLCYDQVAPEDKKAPNLWLMQRFEIGNVLETVTVNDMQNALTAQGIRVEQTNVPIPENEWNIGGKIDCKLVMPDRSLIPVEIKSIQQFGFSKLDTIEDILSASAVYMRNYYGQLLTYMHFTKSAVGTFIFKELGGAYKQIDMEYDEPYMMTLLDKAAIVKQSVDMYREALLEESGDVNLDDYLPERVPFTGDVCGKCPFLSRCCPDMANIEGVENLLGDKDLAELCQTRDMLISYSKDYKHADDAIKKHIKAKCSDMPAGTSKVFLVDGFSLTAKAHKRKSYDIPDDVKGKYAREAVTIRTDIESIAPDSE